MYVVATVFFVALDSVAKAMMQSLPAGLVVWGRYASSLALVALALPAAGAVQSLSTRHLKLQLTRGVLLVGATACMFAAVSTLPVALSYAISYVSPLIVLMVAITWLGEKVTAKQAVGAVIGFTGVLLIIRPGFSEWQWPMLYPLGTAVCYALYQILTRVVGHHDSAFTSLFYVTLSGTVVTSVAMPMWYVPMPLSYWALLGLLGLLGTAGHFLLIQAYKGAAASVLSPFVYAQIIWAGLIDIFVFNTSFDPAAVMGAIVVIGGGLLILRSAPGDDKTNKP